MYGQETAYRFNSASGLQIKIYCPKTRVVMDNMTAHGNKGINGGNIAIDFGSEVGTVIINNSNISKGLADKGGGIRLWLRAAERSVQEEYHGTPILFILNSCNF